MEYFSATNERRKLKLSAGLLRALCLFVGVYFFIAIVAFPKIYQEQIADGTGEIVKTYVNGANNQVSASDISSLRYFSIMTATTTGYGDLRPAGRCRTYAALEMLAGVLTLGVVLGWILNDKSLSVDDVIVIIEEYRQLESTSRGS